jgi:hypothetical protein
VEEGYDMYTGLRVGAQHLLRLSSGGEQLRHRARVAPDVATRMRASSRGQGDLEVGGRAQVAQVLVKTTRQ